MIYKLNLGRNCLKVIIRTYGIKEIFIPYYSCKTIWQAIREEDCKIKFYHIDKNFMPDCEFPKESYILYINYFGLFTKNCEILSEKYKNLITDNTQAFYAPNFGIATFNSLRKFFPVQNGAYLQIEKEPNLNFIKDNLRLETADIEQDYDLFKSNELKLNNEEIKLISPSVENAMAKINYEKDKIKRLKIYNKYSQILDKYNLIKLPKLEDNIPYCYPFCTNDEKFIAKLQEFPILKLWDNLPENFYENSFLFNVGAFPLNNDIYSEKIINKLLL